MFRILTILLLLSQLGCAQNRNTWSKVITDTSNKYEISDEDKIVKRDFFGEPDDTVRAELVVNNNSLNKIHFTNAKLSGDTLRILVYEDNEAFSHKYLITVHKKKYIIDYNFLVDVVDDGGGIIPIETTLKLNTVDFTKGKEVRGYTLLKGKYAEQSKDKWIIVNGYFKVIIE